MCSDDDNDRRKRSVAEQVCDAGNTVASYGAGRVRRAAAETATYTVTGRFDIDHDSPADASQVGGQFIHLSIAMKFSSCCFHYYYYYFNPR